MSRLIDANVLIYELSRLCPIDFSDVEDYMGIKIDGEMLDKVDVLDVIDNTPTIDPVGHGRWIYKAARARSVYFRQHVQCNVCGHIRPRLTGDILRYCPYCGARMEQ